VEKRDIQTISLGSTLVGCPNTSTIEGLVTLSFDETMRSTVLLASSNQTHRTTSFGAENPPEIDILTLVSAGQPLSFPNLNSE
jgi:hypothetical protein